MCIHVHTHRYLSMTCSVCVMLLLSMHSGLMVWCALSQGSLPLLLSAFFSCLCVELRSPPRQFDMFMGVGLLCLAHIWTVMLVRLHWIFTLLTDTLSQQTPRFWGFYAFFPLFRSLLWASGVRTFYNCIHWDRIPQLDILVVVFCNGLCLLQRRVSLLRGKSHTNANVLRRTLQTSSHNETALNSS